MTEIIGVAVVRFLINGRILGFWYTVWCNCIPTL